MKIFIIFILSSLFLGHPSSSTKCDVYDLEEIYSTLVQLSKDQSQILKTLELGRSLEDRPIYLVEINSGEDYSKTVVVEFGIHAREWASPSSAMYVIHQLIRPENEHLITKLKWMIIPVLNPDGYQYTKETDDMWRKNRRVVDGSDCMGVDLNRNFPIGWSIGEVDPCEETYRGTEAFSEPESKLIEKLLNKIGATNIGFYVAVHGCAQSVLHAFGHTLDPPPPERLRPLEEAGAQMAQAMREATGNLYDVKSASRLYVAGGAADDYIFTEFNVELVFTLELGFSTYDYDTCFHPDCHSLLLLNKDCFAALNALSKYLLRSQNYDQRNTTRKKNSQKGHARSANSGTHAPGTPLRDPSIFSMLFLSLFRWSRI